MPRSAMVRDLKEALRNQAFLWGFKEFCMKEFNVENLLCWLDVEVYKEEADEQKRITLAEMLYNTYLKSDCPLQVNVPTQLVGVLEVPYKAAPIDMFDELQAAIFRNMVADSLPRFVKSPQYERVAELMGKRTRTRCDNVPLLNHGDFLAEEKQSSNYIKSYTNFFKVQPAF